MVKTTRGSLQKKKVLIVNAFFDTLRRYAPRPFKIPQSMAPVFLAGTFDPAHCDVRIYNEHASGPIADEDLLGWPDMLVLTGLTPAFDRMLHWAAYARSRNPQVVIVAGGPAVRALPARAQRYFDYVCLGGVEEIRDVIRDAFGPAYRARESFPRYDLVRNLSWLGYVESSRYCNFRCGFCSLTGEGYRYEKYDIADVRRQILAQGRKYHLCFIDNNFYGNDRKFFLARIELLKELREAGQFHSWSALVTQDFFAHEDNLRLARESGCDALFSGVESFDVDSLGVFNKRQNTVRPQLELIRDCLDQGIVFLYGMIFDVTRRRICDLREELEQVLASPSLPLPSYCVLTVPLIGTPFFRDCVENDQLLPNSRLRDLDCLTLALRPLDPIEQVADFVRNLSGLRGYRLRIATKALQLVRRYRGQLTPFQLLMFASNAAELSLPGACSRARHRGHLQRKRTYLTSTEYLDPLYTARFSVNRRYRAYFRPTMVTDPDGALAADMLEDYYPDGTAVVERHNARLA